MTNARIAVAVLLAPLVLLAAPAGALDASKVGPDRDVPYVQTPHEVVHRMLEMANVDEDDILYDLGSGDGRIPIAAVRDFGARRGVGVEIDPELVAESRANAKEAGVADRTRFIEGDLFEIDYSEATVLTLYLLPEINLRIRSTILARLEPGSRVVSHHFAMGEWRADAQDQVRMSLIYMWIVPADVAGTWTWRIDGRQYQLTLWQQFQEVLGELRTGDEAVRFDDGSVTGRHLRFETTSPGESNDRVIFSGRVEGDRIRGGITIAERVTPLVAARSE